MRLRSRLSAAALVVLTAVSPVTFAARSAPTSNLELRRPEPAKLAVPPSELAARGVSVSQADAALGLPTFVWATRSHAGAVSPAALESPETAARAYLRELSDLYKLTPASVDALPQGLVHQVAVGPVVVRFAQTANGIEVFRDAVNVLMDRKLELVAVSGHLSPQDAVQKAEQLPAALAFAQSAQDALAHAYEKMTGQAVSPSAFMQVDTSPGGYAKFQVEGAGPLKAGVDESPRAKKVYYPMPDRLEPAWYVELAVAKDAEPDAQMFAFVFSAKDGSMLMKNDLRADAAFTYKVWADPASYLPYDGPQGTEATPHPTGIPDGYQAPFVPMNSITLQNAPFSRNDPWLAANATQTSGNNAEAYADLAAPDGFQAATDFHAPVSAPGVFSYTYDPTLPPDATQTQQYAAVTNLFYANNFLHDWYYDYGFNEQWGNAQAFNYGRGGLDGDSLKVEGQDNSGKNNANMSTPADGARPRMQMYVFDGIPSLEVTAPAAIAGVYDANTASQFGAQTFNTQGDLKILDPAGITDACAAFPAGTFTGKIALVDRGVCAFTIKAKNAQDAGATAVVIANNAAAQPAPGLGGADNTVVIPVLATTKEAGDAFKAQAAASNTVTVKMIRGHDLDRDGTIDNTVIAHEWGHYISNRLIGNSSGLLYPAQRGLGEGWADVHAMVLAVRDSDRTKPGNNLFQGVYALAGYVSAGGANNGYYYGIRRIPYSTDVSKNALTFKHIQSLQPLPTTNKIAYGNTGDYNSEVHASGEVWATMMWECYASLLNAYPFQEAQDRMKAYMVVAYKVTPVLPTLLEARDAFLAVAKANDPADYQRFVNAFAKRGAGLGAFGPDRYSEDLIPVTESFANGANLYTTGYKLNDSVVGCDQDGTLDLGETGNFTFTVYNTGNTTLAPFTGTVSVDAANSTSTAAFPSGTVVSFPSLAPGQGVNAVVPVQLSATSANPAELTLKVAYSDPTLPAAAKTVSFWSQVNLDQAVNSTSDFFEVDSQWDRTWSSSSKWVTIPGAFAHADNPTVAQEQAFVTPWLNVAPTGNFVMQLWHRWSFEASTGVYGPYYDGGVIELTLDGVNWYDLFDLGINPGYTAYLEAGDNPLSERAALVGISNGFPNWTFKQVNFGTMLAGEKVKLRFRQGSDSAVGAYGWDIGGIAFTGITNSPFAVAGTEPSNGTSCNRRPVAVVGNQQVVNEGTLSGQNLTRATITLDGSGSFDPDGQALTYTWTQLAGPPVALTGANTASATFSPDVPYTLQYTFQLVVSDGVEQSVPKTINVYVVNVNRPPVAVATGPATVAEGSAATISLSGTGSTDADGEPLTYQWTQTAGPAVQLTGATAATATFPMPSVSADTTYTFELTVNDGNVDSAPSTVSVQVTNVNVAPTVNAGTDQTVPGRSPVTLTAVGGDADGDALTYAWTQTAGTTVTLANANAETATFASPDIKTPEALTFQVTASDGTATATDTVVVNVGADLPPVANAGSDRNTPSRAVTVLYGSATDPENDAATFAWTQTAGQTVSLDDPTLATPSFTAPSVLAVTPLTFQLTVTANGLTATDSVTINVQAEGMPTADAGADQTVKGRSLVVVQGNGVSPDGSAVAYQWSQTAGPNVTLSNATTSTVTFTSPDLKAEGVVTLQLTVTSHGQTATDAVDITVQADGKPVVNAGADLNVDARSLVKLAAIATDPENDVITLAWTQVSGQAVTLSDASSAEPSFTAPDVATVDPVELVFEVTATANGQTSAADQVKVIVHRKNRVPVVTGPNDVTQDERTLVTLDATAADPDGDTVTWQWTQTGGPTVELTNADTASVTLTTPEVLGDTLVTFSVTATDADGAASEAATVRLLVKDVNRAPAAVAASSGDASSGDRVVLDGSGSTDPDGEALTYAWKQTNGIAATLTGADKAVATFAAPKVEADQTLEFELTVTDAKGLSAAQKVSLKVSPSKTASGCGCATTQTEAGWPNAALFAGALFALLGLRRRRFNG